MIPRSLRGLRRFLGVQILDRAAKLGQVGADPRVLVDRLDRPVEEAVRGSRGLGDLLAPHCGQLVDLLAEFGAVGIERGQLFDELGDALVELAGLLGLERNQSGRFCRGNRLQGIRRIKLELGCRCGLRFRFGRHQSSFHRPCAAVGPRRSTPCASSCIIECKTRQFKRESHSGHSLTVVNHAPERFAYRVEATALPKRAIGIGHR